MSVDNGTDKDIMEQPLSCTLIVQLSLSEANVNAVQLGTGEMISLQNGEDTEKLSVPMIVALDNENFYFGTLAAMVIRRNELRKERRNNKSMTESEKEAWENFRMWNLGKEITRDINRKETDVVTYGNGFFVKASAELLFALFLRYLRTLSEKILKSQQKVGKFSKFLICIPLWFPSKTRQCIKDAGGILGIDLHVINELSLVAYLGHHFSIPSSSPPSSNQSTEEDDTDPSKILVLCENSGYVDMAYYMATCSEMEMVVCTGGNSKLVSDIKMDKHRKTLMIQDDVKDYCNKKQFDNKVKADLARYLLGELRPWLPDKRPKNVLVLGHDAKWVKILEEELYSYYNIPVHCLLEGYHHFGSIFHGIECIGDLLEKLCGDSVKELYPQDLCWSELIRRELVDIPFERVSNSTRMATLQYPLDKIVIHENNVAKRKFHVGTMSISKIAYFRYTKVIIEMELNQKEGIYSLGGVFGCKNGEKELLRTPEEYNWIANCLSEKEKIKLQQVVEEVKRKC